LLLGGEYEGLQVEKVTLRFELVSESLVWALCISDSGVWSLLSKKTTLYFGGYKMGRGSFWLCMLKIL